MCVDLFLFPFQGLFWYILIAFHFCCSSMRAGGEGEREKEKEGERKVAFVCVCSNRTQ